MTYAFPPRPRTTRELSNEQIAKINERIDTLKAQMCCALQARDKAYPEMAWSALAFYCTDPDAAEHDFRKRIVAEHFASTGSTEGQIDKLDAIIKQLFIANGFTIKEGQRDLEPNIYHAAYELLMHFGLLPPAAAKQARERMQQQLSLPEA